jgi:hypothetical protein
VRWAFPGLNTRETALVLWVGGFLLFSLSRREVRGGVVGLLKLMFTQVFIGGLILSAAIFTAATVLVLRWLGYWEGDMTKVAVLWFVGFALVAMFNTKNVDARYFRRLLLRNLGLAVAVAFVVNLHTFPLPVELIFVPMVFLFVMTEAYAESKPELAPARALSAWSSGILGAVALVYSIHYLIGNFDELATPEKIKEFALPLVLTACFLPLLVGLRYMVVWQTMLSMIRFGLHDNDELYRFARRSLIRTCGPHLGKAQLFESTYRGRLWSASSEAEVAGVLDQFRAEWSAGKRVKADAEPPEF